LRTCSAEPYHSPRKVPNPTGGRPLKTTIRVGTGSGFSDDRIEPATDLAERGRVDYLVFECLTERTIARETLTRLKNPDAGYTPYRVERFQAVLPACRRNGVRIVSNMGAANPRGAAQAVRREAQALGLGDVPVAVVTGDDVTEIVRANPQRQLTESGDPVESLLPRMASANAYLGADVIRDALATGAPVVMTGRVADPSLFLGRCCTAWVGATTIIRSSPSELLRDILWSVRHR
jgi:hypothetical protein